VDNLTHSLFAVTLSRTALRRAGPGTTAALIVASNAPDLDIALAVSGGALEYLAGHRGATHGAIGIVAAGLAVASGVRLLTRGARLPALAAVSILGSLLHVLMDLPTSYGTRLLSPWSARWIAVDLLPIIDVYLWAVLLAGVTTMLAWRRRSAGIAIVVLVLMGVDYAGRFVAHEIALARARQLDPPQDGCAAGTLASWLNAGPGRTPARERCLAALPTFTSPFRWRIVRRLPGAYELRDLHLLGGVMDPPVQFTDEENLWVERARAARTARVFLEFARFPAASVTREPSGRLVVRWRDVRFAGGITRLGRGEGQPRVSFAASVRLERDGRIIDQWLGE
jgi:inner membrane protein